MVKRDKVRIAFWSLDVLEAEPKRSNCDDLNICIGGRTLRLEQSRQAGRQAGALEDDQMGDLWMQ